MINNNKFFKVCFASTVVFLTACANWTTIDRVTELDFDNVNQLSGKAIHLDAKQRLVIQKDYGVICAEPSPDALSALALSASGGVTTSTEDQIALAGALSESAGSIGLRTQSIQLMRDALYRVCEAYYGSALNDMQVMMLHQKYQDILLAVLAVEQLTGTMAAAPLMLNTESESESLARTQDMVQELITAREALTKAEGELSALQEAEKKATDDHIEVAGKLAAEKAKGTSGEALKPFEDDVTAKESAKIQATSAREDKEEEIQDRKDLVARLEEAKGSALSSSSASTGGSGQIQTHVYDSNLDSQSVEKVSSAVQAIVSKAFEKDYTVENCMSAFAEFGPDLEGGTLISAIEEKDSSERTVGEQRAFALASLFDSCVEVIQAGLAPTPQLDTDNDGVVNAADKCPNSFPGDVVDRTGCGLPGSLKLPVVKFSEGGYRVSDAYLEELGKVALRMKHDSELTLEIQGHSDNAGDEEVNLALSLKRAEEVKSFFRLGGINAERLNVTGVGSEEPIASNDNAAGRGENRRVELRYK